jgi:hypothetical protein
VVDMSPFHSRGYQGILPATSSTQAFVSVSDVSAGIRSGKHGPVEEARVKGVGFCYTIR